MCRFLYLEKQEQIGKVVQVSREEENGLKRLIKSVLTCPQGCQERA